MKINDLRILEAFLKTVEFGSFSAAAVAVGVTPAAISKNIARLERLLGVRLFQRTTRNLTLTEAGMRFYASASGPSQALAQAIAAAVQGNEPLSGTLKVSVAPHFGRKYVMPIMPDFVARYPGLTLDWAFENRHVDLVKEGFDAAIGAGLHEDANIVAKQLMPIKLKMVASGGYIERYGAPQSLAELMTHNCIRLRSPTTGRVREWPCIEHGESVIWNVKGHLVFNDVDAICEAALLGMGVALLGAYQVDPYIHNGQLIELLPEHAGSGGAICVYYSHYRLVQPKVLAFVKHLSDSFCGNSLC